MAGLLGHEQGQAQGVLVVVGQAEGGGAEDRRAGDGGDGPGDGEEAVELGVAPHRSQHTDHGAADGLDARHGEARQRTDDEEEGHRLGQEHQGDR